MPTDKDFADVVLGGLRARLAQASAQLRQSADGMREVQFRSSLKAAIAHNEINLRVARIAENEERIARLSAERSVLDAAQESSEQ